MTATTASPTLDDILAGIPARVAAGVAWLDQHDPGWWQADQPGHGHDGGPIDLDELSMSSSCYCVLGQRWGNYRRAPLAVSAVRAVQLGFDTQVGLCADLTEATSLADLEAEFAALTKEWRRIIEARRAAPAAPDGADA